MSTWMFPRAPALLPPLQLWLGGGGNANFLYGMSLLWSGLQAVLLLRVLRAAAREEAPKAEGAQEPPADSGAKDAATSADLAEGSSE